MGRRDKELHVVGINKGARRAKPRDGRGWEGREREGEIGRGRGTVGVLERRAGREELEGVMGRTERQPGRARAAWV